MKPLEVYLIEWLKWVFSQSEFKDGATQAFLFDYLNISCEHMDWFGIDEKAQKRFLGNALRVLNKKGVIVLSEEFDYIRDRKAYFPNKGKTQNG